MQRITYQRLVLNGEYLGFCNERGFIYSIFSHYNEKQQPVYSIYAVKGSSLEHLISYPVIREEEK